MYTDYQLQKQEDLRAFVSECTVLDQSIYGLWLDAPVSAAAICPCDLGVGHLTVITQAERSKSVQQRAADPQSPFLRCLMAPGEI